MRLRQEDQEVKASPVCTVRLILKKQTVSEDIAQYLPSSYRTVGLFSNTEGGRGSKQE